MLVPCPAARWAARSEASDPISERRTGVTGQKPRAGRRPDSRKANPRSGETPGTSCGGFIAVKVVGGAGVKASVRCAERVPGGGEAHEGRGSIEA